MRYILLATCLVAWMPTPDAQPASRVPEWTRRAVWYQVFPERFRNGDASNDPTPESIEGAWPQEGAESLQAAGWTPTPWTQDWYRQEDWARRLGRDFYYTVQLRRYGGDLQGLLDALPYLDSLGVTALYLNPVNDAPSLHKYDARNYHHVDVNLGPDPAGDRRIIAGENPADPATWRWTSADSLFLEVVRAVHARGMRIVMDYSWNHTGTQHWAFQDVLRRGAASPYAGWYYIERFDDPATPDTSEFAYAGWAGVRELPELRKVDRTGNPHDGVPYDGNLVGEIRDHVFTVTRRWMDPDADGDPSDGVDGFRLDVAEMVPLGFWRDYRAFVKAINPEATLIGEIWWQRWPTLMMDPAPYLEVFDGVMHYRWYEPARRLIVGSPPAGGGPGAMTPSGFAAELDSLWRSFPPEQLQASMSMAGSHDAPRIATELLNAGVAYKSEANPRARPGYDTGRPDDAARRAQRLLLLLQFTLPGAPHVYYGDEVGMWGADDPDNRKPMVWADLQHEDEATAFDGTTLSRPDAVEVNDELLALYRELIALRRSHADLLADGSVEWIVSPELDAAGVLAYRRRLGDAVATVVVNLSDSPRDAPIPAGRPSLVVNTPAGSFGGGGLPPRSGAVWFE